MVVKEPPPENDECSGAILLEPDGSVYLGNSGPATVDYDYDGLCSAYESLDITAPGVWFKVIGTGDELIATTCHGSEYDTKISVFRGPNCKTWCVSTVTMMDVVGLQVRWNFPLFEVKRIMY